MIPATISSLMNNDDKICTIYRGIHDMVGKDMPLRPLWAEIAGRVDGTCKGKGGPMHLTHPETGVMVTTGIVGSSMPIANGLAWAAKLDGSKQVTVAYFGDGASNIGAFHEALNMASVMKLPVIFVCQNNGFAEHTRYENGTSVDFIAKRAASYSMPGFTVDGNDPFDMYAHAHAAIERARAGEGPTLLECKTFRFMGHVFGDDDKYMTKEEKQAAMDADPLPAFRQKLIDSGIATEAQLAEMQTAIEAEVEDAIEFAMACEFPRSGRTAPGCICRGDSGVSTEMIKMTGQQAINAAIAEAMERDPKVLVLGEDVADNEGGGVSGTTRGLSTRFGTHRVVSTPISEQAIMGAAIGAAMGGYKPIAEIMLMNFTTVAMDMIVNHAAKLRFMSGGQSQVPLVIRTMTGAGYQTAGQHADFWEAWFCHTAGIKVVAASNPADFKGLMLSCIDDPDPCLFIEAGQAIRTPGEVPVDQGKIPLGKARIDRAGRDVTIISYSTQFIRCQAAVAELEEAGISVELIDLRTISPWDRETCAGFGGKDRAGDHGA